jgi:hypothetical protein
MRQEKPSEQEKRFANRDIVSGMIGVAVWATVLYFAMSLVALVAHKLG